MKIQLYLIFDRDSSWVMQFFDFGFEFVLDGFLEEWNVGSVLGMLFRGVECSWKLSVCRCCGVLVGQRPWFAVGNSRI